MDSTTIASGSRGESSFVHWSISFSSPGLTPGLADTAAELPALGYVKALCPASLLFPLASCLWAVTCSLAWLVEGVPRRGMIVGLRLADSRVQEMRISGWQGLWIPSHFFPLLCLQICVSAAFATPQVFLWLKYNWDTIKGIGANCSLWWVGSCVLPCSGPQIREQIFLFPWKILVFLRK